MSDGRADPSLTLPARWLLRQAELGEVAFEHFPSQIEREILREGLAARAVVFLRAGVHPVGVVTEFEFALHEVGPMIHYGLLFWPLDRGAEMLRHVRGVIDTLPDDVNVIIGGISAPPAPFVPEEHRLTPGYATIVVGTGSAESHAGVCAALAAGTKVVMSAHILVPALDPDLPATLSPAVLTGLLRAPREDGGLGYDGLIVTDGIEMQAIAATFFLASASRMTAKASAAGLSAGMR